MLQQTALPVVYLMISAYQVNYLLFQDIASIKYNMLSLSIVASPILLTMVLKFNLVTSKLSVLNSLTLFLFFAALLFLWTVDVLPSIEQFTFTSDSM